MLNTITKEHTKTLKEGHFLKTCNSFAEASLSTLFTSRLPVAPIKGLQMQAADHCRLPSSKNIQISMDFYLITLRSPPDRYVYTLTQ